MKKKVLIIDDSETSRRFIRVILERRGFETTEASTGEEALEKARTTAPDFITLDYQMPDIDGIQICHRLRQIAHVQMVPIVMITEAVNEKQIKEKAFEAGISFYISKKSLEDFLTHYLDMSQRFSRNASVVIVDDDSFTLELLSNFFIVQGIRPVVFRSCEDAMPYIETSRPDLLIIDLYLPGIDGFAMIQMIRQTYAIHQLPILVISGSSQSSDIFKAFIDGANDYLIKPFRRDEILIRLDNQLKMKELEIRLIQAQKMEAVGQLSEGIAHEMNTPLQYIGDNTHFLNKSFKKLTDNFFQFQKALDAFQAIFEQTDIKLLQSEIPKAIHQSLEGINRVTAIVRSFKEFSHPDNSHPEYADINQALQSSIEISRNRWKQVANLSTKFDSNLPPLRCYIGELSQAFLNMIVNASDAVGEIHEKDHCKGMIEISTQDFFDAVEIRIRDSGNGIPKDILPRIFDSFFTTKKMGVGSGQGLSQVYQTVVGRHKGLINVDTKVGLGTTFIIRLPKNKNE